ncbi:MAG: ATP-binding protein [Desulfobulbaceae bacterium]|nr:ATP-binding protein [Desulfobulbaceae bacterium]
MGDGRLLLRFSCVAGAAQLAEVRARIRRALAGRADAEEVDSLVLAVNEACMNIIQHAYGPGQNGDILLELFLNDDGVTVRITDFAAPVDWSRCYPRDLDDLRPGGLGLHLINELMDEVLFLGHPDGRGNALQMKKKWRR